MLLNQIPVHVLSTMYVKKHGVTWPCAGEVENVLGCTNISNTISAEERLYHHLHIIIVFELFIVGASWMLLHCQRKSLFPAIYFALLLSRSHCRFDIQ